MPEQSPLDEWRLALNAWPTTPTILICGSKSWEGSVNLDHRKHVPSAIWKTTDIEHGPEVDLCFDLQTMWLHCESRFAGICCPSVLEHVERPWTAIHSMAAMLEDGGCLFLQTHQTFPLHFYPNDYFRFSQDALRVMCEDSGLSVINANYECPCTIVPPKSLAGPWNTLAEAFLNVTIFAQKV